MGNIGVHIMSCLRRHVQYSLEYALLAASGRPTIVLPTGIGLGSTHMVLSHLFVNHVHALVKVNAGRVMSWHENGCQRVRESECGLSRAQELTRGSSPGWSV